MFGDLEHFGDLLRRNARWRGSETGIVYGETRLTWRQLNARANRFARAIRLRGVRQHDRVAVLSRNCHEYVEVLFGLAKIGVVAVPINYRLADPEVEFICRDSGAVALIADADHLSTAAGVASRVPTVRQLIAFGDHGAEAETSYDALVRASDEGEPVAERPIAPDDLLLFLYTSGTTGFPKGVMYTHRGTLVGMLVHVLAIGSHADHRVMLPAPLYSAAGMAGIFCGVYVGSHIVLINFDPQLALETIERERITFTNFVPTTIQMLTTLENVERYDLSSMKVLLYGGAPMPEPVLRRAAGVFKCDFRQTYATSETGCSGTVLEPSDHRRGLTDGRFAKILNSCGRPQSNVGFRLVDARGEEAAPGEVGEITILADGNMAGYWNNPEATAQTLREGWVYTGDLATEDEDGYVYLVDRKHDMIVSGALNVYPTEVERVIYQHPAVLECAVIGVPHEVWGEAVKAVVVLKPRAAASEQELIAFCRSRLGDFKSPKSVEFTSAVPRNLTGKILRRVLREPYWEGRARRI